MTVTAFAPPAPRSPLPSGPSGPSGPAGRARLRLLPVPSAEPPLVGDDAPEGLWLPVPGQTALALDAPGEVASTAAPRRLPGTGALPDPSAWAAQFVRLAVEVADGVRPDGQLSRWTSDDVRLLLARRARLSARSTRRTVAPRAHVVTMRCCHALPGAVEVAAVVRCGARVRAVALRMDAARDRWQVTALEIG